MSDQGKQQAWAAFWSEGQSGGGGCLAGAGDELGAAQAALWRRFASRLPKRARVIDLGTGDGIVLRQLGAARPDLKLTGVDSAPSLPPARGKLRLQAGVAMEELPFADSSFEAAVSQFGYEYGDTGRAAREVARVLAPGGRLLFLVHRQGSPILAHNRARAEALRWAATDSGLFERARSLAAARQATALPTPASFHEAISVAAQRFPGQAVAAEIAQAVLQSLGLPAQHSLAAIDAIERKAAGELIRLDALAAAARDSAGAAALAAELRAAGLRADDPETLANRSGEAFAWILSGAA